MVPRARWLIRLTRSRSVPCIQYGRSRWLRRFKASIERVCGRVTPPGGSRVTVVSGRTCRGSNRPGRVRPTRVYSPVLRLSELRSASATPCEAPRHAALFWPVGPTRSRGSQALDDAARCDEAEPWSGTMHVWCTPWEEAREGEMVIDGEGRRIATSRRDHAMCSGVAIFGEVAECAVNINSVFRFPSPSRSRVRFIVSHVNLRLWYTTFSSPHTYTTTYVRARARVLDEYWRAFSLEKYIRLKCVIIKRNRMNS